MSQADCQPELTILFPCLNEEETIGTCIQRAKNVIDSLQLNADILVSDNGSSDESIKIADSLGARVCHAPNLGYGSALWFGIGQAKSKYVIFADADDSYKIEDFPEFLAMLREGNQFVIGNRFMGGIEAGAMPWLNRYVGNPILSGIGRILFGCKQRDFHCGIRGIERESFQGLNLECSGMEFASEMVIKANLANFTIAEIPTGLRQDGRSKPPHLRPFRDGFRHLHLMLSLKLKQLKRNSG